MDNPGNCVGISYQNYHTETRPESLPESNPQSQSQPQTQARNLAQTGCFSTSEDDHNLKVSFGFNQIRRLAFYLSEISPAYSAQELMLKEESIQRFKTPEAQIAAIEGHLDMLRQMIRFKQIPHNPLREATSIMMPLQPPLQHPSNLTNHGHVFIDSPRAAHTASQHSCPAQAVPLISDSSPRKRKRRLAKM